ncbi:MAG: hypothetical protein HZT40_04240 [Candidatus Thiothrix singaporensis]|uniref:Uncharacterized protein n=1 Tax=Candidatus Thiothrix singaporensis TaxID=2799669 RepID=A0A7L6APG9_9GAMM|nr:MAG: hypothetical protein HZT40_04240 [Candidatus Thiothrix singaporensis]
MKSQTTETVKKSKPTKAQKNAGIKLWDSVKEEVYFVGEFSLQGERQAKAERYLHELKRRIWRISLSKGTRNEALGEVFKYNKAINDLLADIFEPWTKTKNDELIKRASIWDLFKSATDVKMDALDPMHLDIGDVVSVQWKSGGAYFNYEVMPDCETLHVTSKPISSSLDSF